MTIIYFIGGAMLLTGLIYGVLSTPYRDRRKDRVTDQIVRDRFDHHQT
jgi:hypothetical protein